MSTASTMVLTQRDELLARLSEARRQSDDLFAIVKPGYLYERPIAERHRIIFYVGHLEAFDWNLLRERLLGMKSLSNEFDQLFAFGIDPVGGGLPADQPQDWPSLEVVRNYVDTVRATLEDGLAALAPWRLQAEDATTWLNVAIEHRLMHAETLAYMLHQLPYEQKVGRPGKPTLTTASPALRTVNIPAGRATLGQSHRAGAFGWDNEYNSHIVEVPAFAIDTHMVTNAQYLEFIAAGGYDNRSLWNDLGWEWRTTHNIQHPVFWTRSGDRDQWRLRTMFDEIPLPPDWPVYVSHAEANACARWAGKALPSEAQWHRAAYGAPDGCERFYPWGGEASGAKRGNFDFASWDPVPVGAFPEGRSAFGLFDLIGNGWEWTSTLFQPFPGFQPFPFYRGYSTDFFDGKHYVIKGGSARTAASMLRRSFRNWFQPHYQYVYAGFRCVTN